MRELEEFLINEGEWNEEQKMKGRMASFKDAREHDTEVFSFNFIFKIINYFDF